MEKYIFTTLSIVVLYAVIGMVFEQSMNTGMIIVHSPSNKQIQKGIIVHKPAESRGIIVHKPAESKGIIVHKPTGKSKQEKLGVSVGGGFRKASSQGNLESIIKDTEAQQETLRNKRQMASTAFQQSDQRQQQIHNQMTSILKTMQETRTAASRGGP